MSARSRSAGVHPEHDGVLLSRVAAGETAALGILYDRHYTPVLSFARRVTARADDAEDLVQEAFLVAARVAATFDGRASCRPWLFGIVSRIVLQRNRAGARFARFVGRLGHTLRESPASPEALSERSQLRSALGDALERLSPAKRIVLIMAESEEMSCDEISVALGIPVGTVWTRLHHARRELRTRLARSES